MKQVTKSMTTNNSHHVINVFILINSRCKSLQIPTYKTHVLCVSWACRRPRGPIADLTPPTPASRCPFASATLIAASVFSCLAFCAVRGIGVPWFPQQRVMWRRHGRSGAARGHLWVYVCVLWSLVGLLPETGGADWWWVTKKHFFLFQYFLWVKK